MKSNNNVDTMSKLLEEIKALLQQMVVLQLYKSGYTQKEIANNLKVGIITINQMLKGIKKEKG